MPNIASSTHRAGLFFEQLWRDARFSFRSLCRARAFSATIVITLALCLGANTTILSALYGLILKPLPYRDPGQLVEIYTSFPKTVGPKRPNSVPQYLDYKANADLFEGFALWRVWTFNIGEESDPDRGIGARVTPDYFSLLGVQPLLGRFYTLEQCVPGNDAVVVLTQTCWETRYHADPDIVGKTIRLGSQPFTIVGVAPRATEALNGDTILFKPFEWTPAQANPAARISAAALMYARIKPGVSHVAALTQLATLEQRFAQTAPAEARDFLERSGYRVELAQVRVEQTKSVRTGLLLLQGGALLVLLLGCINVANLMLARANGRRQELAVRQALGAGFGALARQLLIEGWLLALAGAALGSGIAWSSMRVLNRYRLALVREAPDIALDGTVLAATLLASFGVAMFIGLLPIIRVWRTNLATSIQAGSRSVAGSAGLRAASGVLVTAQVAFALMLLVGASLLLRSFARVMAVDVGFETKTILHARVALNTSYQGLTAAKAAQDLITEKFREIPGVESVGVISGFPMAGDFPVSTVPIRGVTLGPEETWPTARVMFVSPEYLRTLGIRLIDGREFTAADCDQKARRVFIVDRAFAEKNFPGQSAVGREFAFGPQNENEHPLIVGVAENAKFAGPEDRSGVPFIYAPLVAAGGFSFEVRTKRSLDDMLPLMREKLRSVDPALPLYLPYRFEDGIHDLLANRRGVMLLLGAFAFTSLVLSAVGIYGMLAYDVTQRTREIGIRGAIGATRGQIVGLILRQGMMRALIGAAAGLVAAFVATRYIQSLLFDVAPHDPIAFIGVPCVLIAVACIASYVPARRAAKIDPLVALRQD